MSDQILCSTVFGQKYCGIWVIGISDSEIYQVLLKIIVGLCIICVTINIHVMSMHVCVVRRGSGSFGQKNKPIHSWSRHQKEFQVVVVDCVSMNFKSLPDWNASVYYSLRVCSCLWLSSVWRRTCWTQMVWMISLERWMPCILWATRTWSASTASSSHSPWRW